MPGPILGDTASYVLQKELFHPSTLIDTLAVSKHVNQAGMVK
jgi:hypothetical protein